MTSDWQLNINDCSVRKKHGIIFNYIPENNYIQVN